MKMGERQNVFPGLARLGDGLQPIRSQPIESLMTRLGDACKKRHVQLALSWSRSSDRASPTAGELELPTDAASEMREELFQYQHQKISQQRIVAFRIVHLNPKVIESQFDMEDDHSFGPHTMCMEVLPIIGANMKTLELILEGSGQVYTMDMLKTVESSKLTQFMVWASVPSSAIASHDFPVCKTSLMGALNMAEVYGKLHQAWHNFSHTNSEDLDPTEPQDGAVAFHKDAVSDMGALANLVALMHVKEVECENVDFKQYALTQKGADNALITLKAVNGTKLTNKRGDVTDCAKMSVVDCLLLLEEASWVPTVVADKVFAQERNRWNQERSTILCWRTAKSLVLPGVGSRGKRRDHQTGASPCALEDLQGIVGA